MYSHELCFAASLSVAAASPLPTEDVRVGFCSLLTSWRACQADSAHWNLLFFIHLPLLVTKELTMMLKWLLLLFGCTYMHIYFYIKHNILKSKVSRDPDFHYTAPK